MNLLGGAPMIAQISQKIQILKNAQSNILANSNPAGLGSASKEDKSTKIKATEEEKMNFLVPPSLPPFVEGFVNKEQ